MKFPHLFLRPEIIITFLWGWEWSGGQVRHRSPWNSGSYFSTKACCDPSLELSQRDGSRDCSNDGSQNKFLMRKMANYP